MNNHHAQPTSSLFPKSTTPFHMRTFSSTGMCYSRKINPSHTCFGCGEQGHYVRNCPYIRPPEGKGCSRCGKEGHRATQCPNNCPNCDTDHPPEQCPTDTVTCYLCGANDHIPAQCPMEPGIAIILRNQREAIQNILKDLIATKASTANQPTSSLLSQAPLLASPEPQKKATEDSRPGKRSKTFKCFNCGEEGHYAKHCLQGKPMEKFPDKSSMEMANTFSLSIQEPAPKKRKTHKRFPARLGPYRYL